MNVDRAHGAGGIADIDAHRGDRACRAGGPRGRIADGRNPLSRPRVSQASQMGRGPRAPRLVSRSGSIEACGCNRTSRADACRPRHAFCPVRAGCAFLRAGTDRASVIGRRAARVVPLQGRSRSRHPAPSRSLRWILKPISTLQILDRRVNRLAGKSTGMSNSP